MLAHQKVPMRAVAVAIIMLVGFVILAIGYIQGDNVTTYIGLVVTLAGVLPGVVFLLQARL